MTCGAWPVPARPSRRSECAHDAADPIAERAARGRRGRRRRSARSPAARRRRRSARPRRPRDVSIVRRDRATAGPDGRRGRRARRRVIAPVEVAQALREICCARLWREPPRMRSKKRSHQLAHSLHVVLAALRPQHQIADRIARRLPAGQHFGHLCWQSAVRRRCRCAEGQRGASSCARLRRPSHAGKDLVERPARGRVRVRRAGCG